MATYIAAYDISNDEIRRRVSKVLSRYGRRIQLSVFELRLETGEVSEIQEELGALLAARDDFDLIPVDTRHPARRLRWQRHPHRNEPVICI